MMNSKTRVWILAVAAVLTLAAAGCGSSGSSATPGVPVLQKAGNLEKTSLNVAVEADMDSAGFFVALHEGLFAQEGLQVHYVPAFTNSNIVQMSKGQVDLVGMDYVELINAEIDHTAQLRVFAEGSRTEPGDNVIMVMPHSKVQSLQALKGQVLGVNPSSNIGSLLVASLLAGNGLQEKTTPGNSANSVMLPTSTAFPFPASQPLISGQVPAVIMSQPYATELAEQDGATVIADANTGEMTQFPVLGYATTQAWAKANPNTLKAFDIALEAGQQLADTDRAAVEAAYVALPQGAGHVDQLTASEMALDDYPLGVSVVQLQRVANVMQQYGFIKQHFDIQPMVN